MEVIVNIKKIISPVLFGAALFLLPAAAKAAATGAVSAKIAIELKGKVLPISEAQVTILDKAIDLEAIDFLSKQEAEKAKNKKRAYHLYRYVYLVREIEDSRRVGVRQIRHGIVTKRADGMGEVLVRYLEPGDYFIGAYRKMGEKTVVWFVPFSVTAGRTTPVILDNSNVFEFYYPALYP